MWRTIAYPTIGTILGAIGGWILFFGTSYGLVLGCAAGILIAAAIAAHFNTGVGKTVTFYKTLSVATLLLVGTATIPLLLFLYGVFIAAGLSGSILTTLLAVWAYLVTFIVLPAVAGLFAFFYLNGRHYFFSLAGISIMLIYIYCVLNYGLPIFNSP